MNTMYVYYKGELLQVRAFSDKYYKNDLLRYFKKIYGKRFSECEVICEPSKQKKTA